MFTEGDHVEVTRDGGSNWIAAKFLEVDQDQPRHIDNPGVNDGKGYDADQFWVQYLEGDLEATTGLHIMAEIRRPQDAAAQ